MRQGYLERAAAFPDRYVVVDATQELSEVQRSLEGVMASGLSMSDTSELALAQHDATPPWFLSHLREWTSGAEDKGHAYLVVSEDAEEASVFARQLAMQQLCHDLQDGMACGHCQSCKAFLQGTHGDLLSLQVLEGKTAIGIDQVRRLHTFCSKQHCMAPPSCCWFAMLTR